MAKKGMGGHQSQRAITETWLTPREILAPLGPFDLDPCSAPNPELWPTAQNHFTFPQQNGLLLPWEGRVWLNPPYGREMGRWLARMAEHGRGTSMIFARTETDAFFSYVWEQADAVMFLKGRVHFHLPDGTRSNNNGGAPSVLIAYGAEDAERLIESGLDGAIVPLKRAVMLHIALEKNVPMPAWKSLVLETLRQMGGKSALQELYKALENHPKARANPHYKEKIRQTVTRLGLDRVDEGVYALAV